MTQPSIVAPATVIQQLDRSGLLDSGDLRLALRRCERVLRRHSAYLTRLDAVLGDGDHGDNLSIGFRAVDDLLRELPQATLPGDLLRAVGHRLVAAVGGASGPLYGTAFIEAGFRAGDRPAVDAPQMAVMLQAAADGVARRGRCEVGDKTILDTLEPAARAFSMAIDDGRPVDEAWGAAVSAGWRGMLATRGMVARRGLALRLGDRSVGHLDPGAASCLLLLRAFGGR
ncbi:MAG: dihydroxyacetone kinase subunit DhaL [Candidatus Limnocylindrales bacterium]